MEVDTSMLVKGHKTRDENETKAITNKDWPERPQKEPMAGWLVAWLNITTFCLINIVFSFFCCSQKPTRKPWNTCLDTQRDTFKKLTNLAYPLKKSPQMLRKKTKRNTIVVFNPKRGNSPKTLRKKIKQTYLVFSCSKYLPLPQVSYLAHESQVMAEESRCLKVARAPRGRWRVEVGRLGGSEDGDVVWRDV